MRWEQRGKETHGFSISLLREEEYIKAILHLDIPSLIHSDMILAFVIDKNNNLLP